MVMAKQLGFLMNLKRCIGCKGCEMACQNEHRLQEHRRRKIIDFCDQEQVSGFISMACNHCANPACMAVCPNKCFKKRRDGIVYHDPINCIGCKSCVGACPFGAPKYSSLTGKVDKCNMCVDRQEKGYKPACVSACIVEALQVIDINNGNTDYSRSAAGVKIVQFTDPSARFILPDKPQRYWVKRMDNNI